MQNVLVLVVIIYLNNNNKIHNIFSHSLYIYYIHPKFLFSLFFLLLLLFINSTKFEIMISSQTALHVLHLK